MVRPWLKYAALISLSSAALLAQQTTQKSRLPVVPAGAAQTGAAASTAQPTGTATVKPNRSGAAPQKLAGKTNRKGKPTSARATSQAAQPQPTLPPTPEQMPPQPPQVRLANGMLTIEAPNSTLGDVLTMVRRQTGAALDLPPGAATERIVAHLGPGQPRDVIASLLAGSNFDYIILDSLQRPGALDRIILTNRQNQAGGSAPAVAETPSGNAGHPGQPVGEPDTSEVEEDNTPDREAETPPEAEPEQPQPAQPGAPNQPGAQPQGQGEQQNQPQNQGEQQNQPQVKTPEQLLRELQQMRQQQVPQQQQNPQQQPPQEQQPPPQDTPNQPPQ